MWGNDPEIKYGSKVLSMFTPYEIKQLESVARKERLYNTDFFEPSPWADSRLTADEAGAVQHANRHMKELNFPLYERLSKESLAAPNRVEAEMAKMDASNKLWEEAKLKAENDRAISERAWDRAKLKYENDRANANWDKGFTKRTAAYSAAAMPSLSRYESLYPDEPVISDTPTLYFRTRAKPRSKSPARGRGKTKSPARSRKGSSTSRRIAAHKRQQKKRAPKGLTLAEVRAAERALVRARELGWGK